MAPQGSYSVFIGNLGWFYGFPTITAARTFVAGHEGRRYDIHKGSKLVESGKVHAGVAGGPPWLVRNPIGRNPRRPPGYGTIKGAERQWKRQTDSHVAGKRSKSRGTHKYYREGFAAADRQEQEAMRKKRGANPYSLYSDDGFIRGGIPTLSKAKEIAKKLAIDQNVYVYEAPGPEALYSTPTKLKATYKMKYPKSRNPATEYGVVIHGNAALSKAGFPSLAAARKYLGHLMSRGVLRGRSMEILKIDNVRMTSTRVAEKAYNPLPVGKYVTVKAKRLPNGRVELRGIR